VLTYYFFVPFSLTNTNITDILLHTIIAQTCAQDLAIWDIIGQMGGKFLKAFTNSNRETWNLFPKKSASVLQ
jgi:hypothetical protein